MSKKLLALLVAVSTCCAFGCSDDDSDSCKTGEKRCDGNNAQICVNGNWSKGTPCANGCDKATGVCKEKAPDTGACTTAGEKRCSGKQLQECKDGNWSKLEDCAISCDEATKACKDGGKCTATSTSQCTGSCSADKKTGYFWSKEALKTVDCPNADCTDTNGYVQCGETPACTATSTERCNVACSADKSVGYYWNSKDKKVGERKCPNKDCIVEGTSVKCESGSEPTCTGEKVQTGGEEGACCDAATYQVSCINENANALICAKGAVKKWTCKDNICSVGSDNKVKCDNPNGTGGGSGTGDTDNLEDCTATSNAKCKVACNDDKSVGYYWNGNKSEVGKRECPNKDCIIEGTSVKCAGASTCDQKPVCNEAGNKVTYCSSSSGLTDKDCPQCYVDDDTFWCNGDQNLPKCAKGATSKCIGTCLSDTEGVFWDNNTNAVKDKTCTAPKKCNATKSGYVSCK